MKTGRAGLGLLALLATALAVVQASVFVYYTTNYTLAPTAPPVILARGENAGQPDLFYGSYGYKITVTVSSAGATATVTLHPTYSKNYYKSILWIQNQDTNTYWVHIRVKDPLDDPKIINATMIAYNTAGTRVTLDLKTTNAINYFPIGAGVIYRVDVVLVIDEAGGSTTTAPQLTDTTFQVEVIYSPYLEAPP